MDVLLVSYIYLIFMYVLFVFVSIISTYYLSDDFYFNL